MYYKSVNLWIRIGYHIAWNIFQFGIYGMPVSAMNVSNIITMHYPANNVLNDGFFEYRGWNTYNDYVHLIIDIQINYFLNFRYQTPVKY